MVCTCLVMRKDILDKYNLDVSNGKSLADCAPIFETIHENEPDMKIIVGALKMAGSVTYILLMYFPIVLSIDNGGC